MRDLEQHTGMLAENDRGMFLNPFKNEVLQSRLDEFRRIFKDMYLGVREVHAAGLLHLDLGTRNFAMSEQGVRVLDFGGSCPMDANGRARDNPDIHQFPIYLFDQKAVLSRKDPNFQLSTVTDFFAIKVAMMEALCRYMGADIKKICPGMGEPGFREKSASMSDEDRLKQSLHALERIVRNCPDTDGRKLVAQQLIQEYGKFLTSAPKGNTRDEIARNDSLNFPDQSVVIPAPQPPVMCESGSYAAMMQALSVNREQVEQLRQAAKALSVSNGVELKSDTSPGVSSANQQANVSAEQPNSSAPRRMR